MFGRFTGKSTVTDKKTVEEKSEYTNVYGDTCIAVLISTTISRLCYMDPHTFLGHYENIFGPLIPNELLTMMNDQIVKRGIKGIFNDTEMFKLSGVSEKWGLKTYSTKQGYGGTSLQFLPWVSEINKVNGEQRKSASDLNCNMDIDKTVNDPDLVMVTIATSNYGEVYVIGNRQMPNVVTVGFRGTRDAQGASSYVKVSSVTPVMTGTIHELEAVLSGENSETFIFGIYKILMDIIHILMDSIQYVAQIINPTRANGNTYILTTGHSLGGALSTIFAYVYVVHIASLPNFHTLYPNLDENIGCFSLGSPRIFGKNLSNIFCCLTTSDTTSDSPNSMCDKVLRNLKNIRGRISYSRIVTNGDLVPSLPSKHVSSFVHPCSSVEDIGAKRRQNVTVDCNPQIANSFSTRCLKSGRPSITIDYTMPLDCQDSADKRKKSHFKPPSSVKNPIAPHLLYNGISFAGGAELGKVLDNVERVRNSLDMSKKGNTVCRLVFYPGVNGQSPSSMVFYDLVTRRSLGLGVSDTDFEAELATEKEEGTQMLDKHSKNTNTKPSPSQNRTYAILQNLIGKKTPVAVAEDIYDTEGLFKEMIKEAQPFDILEKNPSFRYNDLASPPKRGSDASFQGATSSRVAEPTVGGRKTKKNKKHKSTNKNMNKKRNNKTTKNRTKKVSKR
jgi:hypothetical protein